MQYSLLKDPKEATLCTPCCFLLTKFLTPLFLGQTDFQRGLVAGRKIDAATLASCLIPVDTGGRVSLYTIPGSHPDTLGPLTFLDHHEDVRVWARGLRVGRAEILKWELRRRGGRDRNNTGLAMFFSGQRGEGS